MLSLHYVQDFRMSSCVFVKCIKLTGRVGAPPAGAGGRGEGGEAREGSLLSCNNTHNGARGPGAVAGGGGRGRGAGGGRPDGIRLDLHR